MKLNEEAIGQVLFDEARDRIVASYGLKSTPRSAQDLLNEVITVLAQEAPAEDTIPAAKSDAEVFTAAVRAIASGARSWVAYMDKEPALKDLLGDGNAYHPAKAATANPTEIIALLPGQGQARDAENILTWAHLLTSAEGQNYYSALHELYDQVLVEGQSLLGGISMQEAMIVVTCVLGYSDGPSQDWKDRTRLGKWPGMGFALGSEFMRNLGWSGFKPDRHIIRLLGKWAPKDLTTEHENRAAALVRLAGRDVKELKENATFALAGIAVTPEGMSVSKADNLLWLLGSQVVKNKKHIMAQYPSDDFFTES